MPQYFGYHVPGGCLNFTSRPQKSKQRPGIAHVLKLDILPVLSCTSLVAKWARLLGCACALRALGAK